MTKNHIKMPLKCLFSSIKHIKTGEIALSSVKTHKSTVKMLIFTEKLAKIAQKSCNNT